MTPEMGLQQPELTSSNSFRVEYRPEVTPVEMSKDIKSYLFEFRLQAQKYDYDLDLSIDDNGNWRLADPDRGEAMTTKAYRAVLERKLRGEPIHREEAEFAGLTHLEQQLGEAQVGDSIIWFSPQGPEEEGYAQDYAFGFSGRVVDATPERKAVQMTANRFESPTLDQYNEAFKFLVGTSFNGQHADDFLRMPVVVKGGVSSELIDLVFASTFGFEFDPAAAEANHQIYETRIKRLADEFIANYTQMSSGERRKSIHAMENIAIEAKRNWSKEVIIYNDLNLTQAIAVYGGYEPEEVRGSCPVTKSNNPMESASGVSSLLFRLPEDKYGAREVECPNCHQIVVRPKDKLVKNCTHCGSDKISC